MHNQPYQLDAIFKRHVLSKFRQLQLWPTVFIASDISERVAYTAALKLAVNLALLLTTGCKLAILGEFPVHYCFFPRRIMFPNKSFVLSSSNSTVIVSFLLSYDDDGCV